MYLGIYCLTLLIKTVHFLTVLFQQRQDELLVAYSVTVPLLDILTPSVEVAHVPLFETQ